MNFAERFEEFLFSPAAGTKTRQTREASFVVVEPCQGTAISDGVVAIEVSNHEGEKPAVK